jgi:hypothetical protein
MKNISELSVGFMRDSSSGFLQHLSKLTHLKALLLEDLYEDVAELSHVKCPLLESLKLRNCYFTPAVVGGIAENFPLLKEFEILESDVACNISNIIVLLNRFKNLENLAVCTQVPIRDFVIDANADETIYPKLKKIDLEFDHDGVGRKDDWMALLALMMMAPNLKKLAIINCPLTADYSLMKTFAKSLCSIKELQFGFIKLPTGPDEKFTDFVLDLKKTVPSIAVSFNCPNRLKTLVVQWKAQIKHELCCFIQEDNEDDDLVITSQSYNWNFNPSQLPQSTQP